MKRLQRDFYSRPALQVARDLLGRVLVKLEGEGALSRRIAGIITETEAYCGEADLACHAKAGRTPRTQVMYGPPGHAYVYFTYGMHWMLNFVAEPEDSPSAILIRAVKPVEGLDLIAERRLGRPESQWADGPGKLAQAYGIDGALNGADLCARDARLFVEAGQPAPEDAVTISPRVGLYSVPEPWKSKPWRYRIR